MKTVKACQKFAAAGTFGAKAPANERSPRTTKAHRTMMRSTQQNMRYYVGDLTRGVKG